MRILTQAFEAVRENVSALVAYLAVTVPLTVAYVAAGVVIGAHFGRGRETDPWFQGYAFLVSLVMAAGYAIAQSIGFARLGKILDRPVWKISGDREALRRFFALWFLLNLAALAVIQLCGRATAAAMNTAQTPVLAVLYLLLALGAAASVVPLGACVMFYGALDWSKIGEILAPLKRQSPAATRLFLFAYIEVFFALMASEVIHQSKAVHTRWFLIPLEIVDGVFMFIMFAWTWLICMADRNEPKDEDIPF